MFEVLLQSKQQFKIILSREVVECNCYDLQFQGTWVCLFGFLQYYFGLTLMAISDQLLQGWKERGNTK